jgi:hypothetical protein
MSHPHTPQHLHQAAEALDQFAHAALARASAGLSPVSVARAWTDWLLNLTVSPGTQARLGTEAQLLALAWAEESLRAAAHRLVAARPGTPLISLDAEHDLSAALPHARAALMAFLATSA